VGASIPPLSLLKGGNNMSDMTSTLQVPLKFRGRGKALQEKDLPTLLAPLLAHGYRFSLETGALEPTVRASGFDTPWIYVKGIDSKNCNIDHNIKFKYFNYIPPRCLQCWKVVVRPRTYKELYKLFEIERTLDVPCKCGIEVRQYTPANYGGYFYNESLEEGRERYEQVRKAINEHISSDVPVILKRGCTEYEAGIGPSPMWVMPDKMKPLDELLDMYVSATPVMNGRQSEVQRAHVMKRWMIWAHNCGDMTYLDDNDGQPLVDPPVEYQGGDIDGVKSEMAIAEAHNLHLHNTGQEIDPQILVQYRELQRKYSIDYGVAPSVLSHAGEYMGYPKETVDGSDQTS
jgi:hypothetical protein